MKILLSKTLLISLALSQPAMAHMTHANNLQHASEHLLLAVLLAPVLVLVYRKLFR
jgi:hypothetical protein